MIGTKPGKGPSLCRWAFCFVYNDRAARLLMPAGRFYFLLSRVAVGLASGLATLFCLRTSTYRRLLTLNQDRIATTGEFSERMPLSQTGRWPILARSISELLKSAQE